MADVTIENHGTVFLFYPQTEVAWDWITDNIHGPMQRYGPAIAVERRFAWDIAEGMMADGLEVE